MQVDHEPSVKRPVEKQKSMITHQRTSCPPPSADDLAGRDSHVRFCPWAFRLALDGANSQWRLLLSRKGAHLWVDCIMPIALTLVFGYVGSYGASLRRRRATRRNTRTQTPTRTRTHLADTPRPRPPR